MRNRLCAAMVMVGLSAVTAWAETIQMQNVGSWRRSIDPNHLAALTRQTLDPTAAVRAGALEEIGRLRAAEAWEVVAERLADKDAVRIHGQETTVAAVACASLGLLGEQRAVPHVIPLLEDPQLQAVASKALYLLKHRFQVGSLQVVDLLQDTIRSPERGSKQDLLDPLCSSDPMKWRAWWIRQGLGGREILVRVYTAPEKDPSRFHLVRAVVPDESIPSGTIPLGAIAGADPCSILVICPQDQQDEDLRLMMGRWITAQPVSEGRGLSVPDRLWQIPGDHLIPDRWTIEDALGDPIAGACVEVWFRPTRTSRGHLIFFGRWTAAEGSIEAIAANGGFGPQFVVSHPDYGKARVPAILPQADRVRVPLVRLSSDAGSRAIWGTVVNDSGRPVRDVTIQCSIVRLLSGNPIPAHHEFSMSRAITDANGFFALYVPPENRSVVRMGTLIPPGSRYQIRVEPPGASSLLPCETSIENGVASRIVLERGSGRVRTFVFATDAGVLEDVRELERITIEVHHPGKAPIVYPYPRWSTGAALPEGKYVAVLHEPGRKTQFEPVQVSQASPDTILFRLPAARTYSGRVIHARTGQPLAGAFVLAQTARGRGRLSDLTDAQWDTLAPPDGHPILSDALEPVRGAYEFRAVVRTDAEGGYRISVRGGDDSYGLICFSRDYVPVLYRTAGLAGDALNRVAIPPIRLYPAAKVEVQARTSLERVAVTAKWRFREGQVPSWARDLCSEPADGRLSFDYTGWYAPNIPQSVYVPANVPLQLEISAPYEDRLCACTYPQSVCLPQGSVMDLGSCTLPESLMLILRVLGPDGKPREGVPVNRRIGNSLHLTHQTDEDGLAGFRVPPHSSGDLGVFPSIPSIRQGHRLEPETVAFEVGGIEDQGKQFTLTLSEELLAALFETIPPR